MKKILILYAAYGGGHLSAAKSIKKYIDENYDDVDTQMVDCMKYVNKFLDKITTGAYNQMAKRAPWAWRIVYNNSQKGLLGSISNGVNKLMAKKIVKLFNEFKPDIVISTHPFSSQMTTILKNTGKTNCSLATVMTDFAPHDQWLVNSDLVDYIFVSNDNMKDLIVTNNGITPDKIYVTGIPISTRFSETFDKENIFNDFGLSPNKKTVLFFGGGQFGLGRDGILNILNILTKVESDIQVIAIAGKNEKLKSAFEDIVKENNRENNIKVLAFTDKVPELMSISNLVITKPGGLTTSESLVSGLPLIIINPIPGQEEENAEFLEKFGCGIWIKKDDNAEEIINSLLLDDKKLNDMSQNSINLAKKNSTKDICDICLNRRETLYD